MFVDETVMLQKIKYECWKKWGRGDECKQNDLNWILAGK